MTRTSSYSPSNICFNVLPTSYGRGAFATVNMPKDTLVLECAAPYASVILRKFRKEVCAWCFKYSFENGKNAWSVRLDSVDSGVWFCDGMCRDTWLRDEGASGLRGAVNAVLGKLLNKRKPQKARPGSTDTPLSFLDDLQSGTFTAEVINKTWIMAENIFTATADFSRELQLDLNEFELDTARFVLDALIRRCLEMPSHFGTCTTFTDNLAIPSISPGGSTTPTTFSGNWSDLLELQNNELAHIEAQPCILTSHIRVYAFVCQVMSLALRDLRKRFNLVDADPQLLENIRFFTSKSETVRAILARDHGNVFGIWDTALGDDSEMLGWGMYVFGSYFNHGMLWIWMSINFL